MLETDVLAPSFFIMTLLALLAFLALVDIIRPMATETIQGKFFRVDLAPVAGMTANVQVLSPQWKIRFSHMIKLRAVPSIGFVT